MVHELRRRLSNGQRRVVVKVGTNTVCHEQGGVNEQWIGDLARQLAELSSAGHGVTLVASGAIGMGFPLLGLKERPRTLPMLQASAAAGQGELMRHFRQALARHGVTAAQVLLTRDDFEHRGRYLNIRNTLSALAERRALPVINENDTVAVEEIRFGDNDILAALVANMLDADLLVFLTSVEGVLKDGRVVEVIQHGDEAAPLLAGTHRSRLGSGGMASKMAAAATVTGAGQAVVVAGARTPNVLTRLLAGEPLGTVFMPARRRMSSRRRWIAQASRPTGKIMVDAGAAKALKDLGRSLLPSGVTAVAGRFVKGATVVVLGPDGKEIARGMTNYSAEQVDQIKGLKTAAVARVLGEKPYDEVIHRNNMSLR